MEAVEKNNETIGKLARDIETFETWVKYAPDGTRLNPVQLDCLSAADPVSVGKKLKEIDSTARTYGIHQKIGTLYGFELLVKSETDQSSGFEIVENRFFVRGEGGIPYSYNQGR